MRGLPLRGSDMFIIVVIYLVGSDIYRVAMGANGLTAGLKLMMLFPMLGWTLFNLRFLLRGIVAVPELSGLVGIAILSVLWSAYPSITAERLFPLVVTTAAGMTLGSRLSLRSLLLALGLLASIVVVSSFVAVALLPSARGIPPWEDTWRGVFSHKNGLGSSCMFMLLYASGAAMVSTGRLRFWFIAVALGALALLIEAQSRTSQGIALISMTALVTGIAMRRWAMFWAVGYLTTVAAIGAILVMLFATGIINPILELMGRSPTLSGRLPLWSVTWPYAMDRMWLGYGYQGFWHEDARWVIEISRNIRVGYMPHYSHNSLIETILNTGIVGAGLLGVLFVRLFLTVLNGFRVASARPVLMAALVIIMAFVYLNILESSVLSRESLTWTIFVTMATKLGNVAAAARRARRPGRMGVWDLERALPDVEEGRGGAETRAGAG